MESKTYRELVELYNYNKIDEIKNKVYSEFNLPRFNISNFEHRKISQREKILREIQLKEEWVSLESLKPFLLKIHAKLYGSDELSELYWEVVRELEKLNILKKESSTLNLKESEEFIKKMHEEEARTELTDIEKEILKNLKK